MSFKKVSRLVSMLPSAPKEAPRLTKSETLTRFPATSVSTTLPWLYQLAIGPNSGRES